jgi:undecaprenyl-diphosphatase
MFGSLLSADRAFGIWIASILDGPWIDRVMIAATWIGARGTIWLVMGLGVWIASPARRMAVWRLLLAISLAGLMTDFIVKPLVGRVRPYVDHPEYRELLPPPRDHSFPSGHASTAAAGALSFARILPGTALPATALALLIGTSRIALGVHFPSDVLAGFAIGYLCARFVFARPPTVADREPVLE